MSTIHPSITLTGLFILWKALLLLIVWSAPGDGYDTSTTLLSHSNKLVRWDAIYFVQMAARGHVFEQEWAFGMGISTILSAISSKSLDSIITNGIILAHCSHFISVVCLWQITTIIAKHDDRYAGQKVLPFVACCLHIVAPAGIFLSAPYTESPFSALNMFGFWLYLKARSDEGRSGLAAECLLSIAAGISFGAATTVRSNGVLAGIPFLLDALRYSYEIVWLGRSDRFMSKRLVLLVSTILAGLLIAAGFILPQYIAYQQYCLGQKQQPWCLNKLPLIFSYVQSHYWNVGFLRYWTVSNIPLFLLALPSLTLLLYSSITSISPYPYNSKQEDRGKMLVSQIAIPQMVLAGLAVTNYHVQVITRLSSGYPWLYIWLAKQTCRGWKQTQLSIRVFMVYALIQGALFASFLPPA